MCRPAYGQLKVSFSVLPKQKFQASLNSKSLQSYFANLWEKGEKKKCVSFSGYPLQCVYGENRLQQPSGSDYGLQSVLRPRLIYSARSSKAATQKSAAWEALRSDLICESHHHSFTRSHGKPTVHHAMSFLWDTQVLEVCLSLYYEATAIILLYGLKKKRPNRVNFIIYLYTLWSFIKVYFPLF